MRAVAKQCEWQRYGIGDVSLATPPWHSEPHTHAHTHTHLQTHAQPHANAQARALKNAPNFEILRLRHAFICQVPRRRNASTPVTNQNSSQQLSTATVLVNRKLKCKSHGINSSAICRPSLRHLAAQYIKPEPKDFYLQCCASDRLASTPKISENNETAKELNRNT